MFFFIFRSFGHSYGPLVFHLFGLLNLVYKPSFDAARIFGNVKPNFKSTLYNWMLCILNGCSVRCSPVEIIFWGLVRSEWRLEHPFAGRNKQQLNVSRIIFKGFLFNGLVNNTVGLSHACTDIKQTYVNIPSPHINVTSFSSISYCNN